MTLETYYLTSLSVAATLLSILIIIIGVLAILATIRIRKILDKLEALADTGNDMANDVRSFVKDTTTRLIAFEQAYLTMEGIKKVANNVVEVVRGKKDTEN